MYIRTRIHAVGAAAALAVILTACAGTSSGTAASTPTTSAASSSSPAAVMTTSTGSSLPMPSGGMPMPTAPVGPHNQADITFAQQMTVHHQGAIAMADLAPSRASSAQVKVLAAKIKAAQGPEIAEMAGWLTSWAPATDMNGVPMTTSSSLATMGGMSGTDHGTTAAAMPGMMSDAQMGELAAASGAAFDKLFLQTMITHHQGALAMAETEAGAGQNPAALALAASITSSQTAEIATMRNLLEGQ